MSSSLVGDIAVIMVIYNRRLHECQTYNSLAYSAQNTREKITLIVIDNSPTKMYDEGDHNCFSIHYIHNIDNPGVSKAYNQGAELASSMAKKWLLLTDQDTIFPANSMDTYIKGIINDYKQQIFVPRLYYSKGLLSPVKYLFKRGWPLNNIEQGVHSFRYLSVINSGMLVNLELFLKVNGYNEKVRLDFSDYVFIDRVKQYHRTFTILNIDCVQEVSFEVNSSKDLSLLRFKYFCEGARNATDKWYDYPMLLLNVILRGVKLTLQHRSISFVNYIFRYYLIGI
jgi:GT2 family glycosyltransferase